MDSVALILEGGGMRGAFSAGVLDCMLDQDIFIRDVYGVSAGACNACSYLCRQKGRSIRIWTTYAGDKRFFSLSSWLRTGDYFNADFNYHQIPDVLEPIDSAAYPRGGGRLRAVVTSLSSGQAEYLRVRDMKRDVAMVQASSSLPLLSRPVFIRGKAYLDGGCADSIPFAQAAADGFQKQVLVLTQPEGYRKPPSRAMPLIALRYRRYPAFAEAMRERHIRYNEALDQIARAEAAGHAFVIRPAEDPGISRIEKDPKKLRALYEQGYAVAKARMDGLLRFLQTEADS